MTAADLESWQWLISSEAAPFLASVETSREPLTTRTNRLRRWLSAVQVHLVLEQVELRRRASAKFSSAETMFFTRRALEQATSETVAQWKARRFAEQLLAETNRSPSLPCADLCCGIGGDLLALSRQRPAVGVERDPVTAALARANLKALGLPESAVHCQDVREFPIHECQAWHLDPDRRIDQKRAAQPEFADPGLDAIDRLLEANPHAGIKLAPAARAPENWSAAAELEWISEQGECKQQVAWFGQLARRPGYRSATVLSRQAAPRTVLGAVDVETPVAAQIERCVYEPDAAVLAAGLAGALANEHGLEALSPGIGYYTANRKLHDPALAGFEVLEVAPFDRKRLKALLRERGIERVEIKKRGVDVDIERLQRELAGRGEHSISLLLAPRHGKVLAILARRLEKVVDSLRESS